MAGGILYYMHKLNEQNIRQIPEFLQNTPSSNGYYLLRQINVTNYLEKQFSKVFLCNTKNNKGILSYSYVASATSIALEAIKDVDLMLCSYSGMLTKAVMQYPAILLSQKLPQARMIINAYSENFNPSNEDVLNIANTMAYCASLTTGKWLAWQPSAKQAQQLQATQLPGNKPYAVFKAQNDVDNTIRTLTMLQEVWAYVEAHVEVAGLNASGAFSAEQLQVLSAAEIFMRGASYSFGTDPQKPEQCDHINEIPQLYSAVMSQGAALLQGQVGVYRQAYQEHYTRQIALPFIADFLTALGALHEQQLTLPLDLSLEHQQPSALPVPSNVSPVAEVATESPKPTTPLHQLFNTTQETASMVTNVCLMMGNGGVAPDATQSNEIIQHLEAIQQILKDQQAP